MDITIGTGRIQATIQLQGAMTTAIFEAGTQHAFSPSYIAQWSGWEGEPLLTQLRGDFLCVPFGAAPAQAEDLPTSWRDGYAGPEEWIHGYSSNGIWAVLEQDSHSIRLGLDYPSTSPVERVERTVTCTEEAVEYVDTIVMRSDATLPLGLHPIVSLPEDEGGATLVLPKAHSFHALPIDSGTSVLEIGAVFDDAAAAPRRDGTTLDLTQLPLGVNVDEIVLMALPETPQVSLQNRTQGYEVTIEWDPEFLKHCLLWVSNRGRQGEPWGGNNLCLGIEPITAAFDFGQGVSAGENPLSTQGLPTSVPLKAGESYAIRHRMTANLL